MLHRPSVRRSGVTLLEVLTAIFIMGIGMLALLTLFPLGALSMAQAIRDDRAAHIAGNAAAIATVLDYRNDPAIEDDINKGSPVLIDPAIVPLIVSNSALEFVGNTVGMDKGIKRVAPVITRNPATKTGTVTSSLVTKWFTFDDEIEFDSLGGPKSFSTTTVNRPGTYTWAYLMRRPVATASALTDLSVIVYAQRNLDNPDADHVLTVSSLGTAGTPSVRAKWDTSKLKPDMRKGAWVLDTSMSSSNTRNGHFYRVESATETGTDEFELQFDRPLKATLTQLAVMANVIAVVERGTTWLP